MTLLILISKCTSPTQALIYFCFYGTNYSGHFICMGLYSVTGFFHLACLQESSTLEHILILTPFYCWMIFHYMNTSYSVYPLMSWWTFEGYLFFGCYEHLYKSFCVSIFIFLDYIWVELLNYINSILNHLKKCLFL